MPTARTRATPRPGLRRALPIGVVLLLLCGWTAGAAGQSDGMQPDAAAGWAALAAGGHVAMIRHASAPGPSPDPPGFDPADCATQRNLDARGRAEAAALGDALRRNGVAVARVLTSAWCRCRDTAALLEVGAPAVEPALNNLSMGLGDPAVQVPAMRALVAGWTGPGTLVLVSHGATIGALTGLRPRSSETVVLRPAPATPAGFEIVDRIPPPS